MIGRIQYGGMFIVFGSRNPAGLIQGPFYANFIWYLHNSDLLDAINDVNNAVGED